MATIHKTDKADGPKPHSTHAWALLLTDQDLVDVQAGKPVMVTINAPTLTLADMTIQVGKA